MSITDELAKVAAVWRQQKGRPRLAPPLKFHPAPQKGQQTNIKQQTDNKQITKNNTQKFHPTHNRTSSA
jgi:hypothetical protein